MNDFEALDYFRKQTGSSGTLEDTLRFYEQARKNREEQQAQQQAQQQEAINKLQSIKQGGTTAAVADPEIPAGYTAAYKDKSKPEHPENVFNKALADTSYENRLQTVKDWNASFGSTYLDPASQAALAREIKKGEIPSWGIVKPKSWNIVDNDLFDSARFGLGDVVAGAAQGIGRYFGSDPLVKWGQSEKAAIEKLKETAFSDDTKNKLKRQGEIRQEAAGKGAEAEFVAELKSFATAPLNTIASSAGSFVPAAGLAITATALGAPAAAATGLAILASAALGTSNATDNFEKIAKLPESELRKLKGFDEVLKASGGDIAKARDVIGTQASNEDFWLQAAIEGVGAGLSVASGAGKALIKTFTKNGLSKNAAEKASKEGLKAVAKTTAVETIQEGGVEGASQVSKNRAFNSVGGDVSLLDGVVSATTGGALAGGSLGAGTASVSAIISNSKGAEPSAVDPAKPVAQKTPVQETGAAMAKQSLFDALSTGNIDEIEKARTIYENVGDVELAEKEWGSKNAGTNTNPAGSSANVDNANVQPANNAGVQPASTNAGVPDTESGNATAAGDGTTEGNAGTVDAATQPAVRQATKFAEFIPEETGNKPNTEAINRAITEIKGGGQTINIASAKSWAEQHYDSYVDYVGKNEAQKASKDSFVDGTVANILARAQAVDGNLRGDAKQIAKDRNDTLAKNEPDYEGYSRQEKGDRRTVDGSLRTEPQYRKDQRDFNDALEINTRSKSVDAVIAKVKEKDREPILEKIEAALNLDAKNQLPNDANGLKAIKRLKIDEQESILGITPPSFKKRYLQKAATQGQANAPTTAAEQQTRTGNKVQPSAVVQAKPSAAPMGKEQDSKGRTTDSKVNEPKPIDLVGKFVSYGGIKGLLKEDKQGNLYIESINAGGKVYIDSALSGKNARELGLFGATIRAKAPKTKQEQNAQAQKIENKPYIKPANKDAAESYAAQQDSANALSEAAIKENQQIKEFLDTTGLLSLEYGDEIAGYILEEIEKKLGKNISRESIIKEIEDAINSGYQPFQNAASDDKGNQRNAQGGATENSPASPAKTEAKQESVDDGKTNLDGVPDAALDDVLTKIGLEEKARAKIQSTNLNNPNFLRITKSELFEINPDLPAFYSRKNGVSISTRVADGDFDAWLPYSMRHDSSRFDEIESTNEIKNYLAEILDSKKPFYDYETRMEIKNSSIIIEQLQTQLNELQDTNAINAELASYTESDEYKQWASELAEEQFIADSKDSDTGTTEAKPQPKNESASLGKPTFEQKNGDSTINDIEAALKPKELIKHVKNIYQNTGGIDQNQADNITEKSVNAIKQNDALITNAMLFKAPIDPIRDLKNANSLIIDGLLVRGIGSQIATRFQTHRLNDAGISLIKRIRQLNSELSDAQARKQIDKTDGFLTQPTPEGLRAKTEREAAAPYAERAALDRLQGNTDGGFQLTPQEGRNDASGVLFSQSTAAKNPTTSTAVRSAIEGIFGNAKGVWDSISKSTVIVATRSDVPKDAITVGTLKSLPLAVQDDLLSSYTREDALAKQAREEQAAKDESKPAPAVRGKSFKAEQVDLFNPQNALFSQNDDSAQAFYDPPTGKIYLIADRIQKGTEAAVWLHEVSHKQLLSLLGKENLSKLNSAVTSWHRRKEGSVERAIYEAANARAESAARVVYGETKLSDKQQAIIVDSYNSSIYRGGKKLGTTVDIKQSKESAAVSDAFKALAKDAGYEIKDNNGKETKYFTLTKYDAVLDADVDLQVRVSDHSNINRSQHFGETDINIAPDDGYKTDSFESALWKLNNARIELDSNGITGTLYYGQIKAEPFYSKTDLLTKGEIDKKIYNAEFLAYAIEEAVNRGVTPDAKKGTISAAGWMARVKQLFEGALARLVGKPSMLSANDLVAMAYGAAQLELQGKNAGGNGGAQASLTPFDGKEQAKTPLGGTKTVTVDGKEYSVFNNLGKPIHPTVEGVRNFVRWFGDSKVTDSGKTMAQGGKPKVFYHGTSHAGYKGGAFAAFETYNESGRQNLYGDGAYFTENVDVASSYTTKGRGGAATVYPVYLKIINPLNMDLVNNNAEFKKLFPGEEFSSLDDKNQKTNAKVYKELQEDLAYNEIYDYDANEILRGGIESGGYDGITHIGGGKFNKKDETRHAVFIAFHPEQIKSATGNNGNYNPEKIDIHLSIAPSNPRQSINDAIATLPTESQKAIRDVYGENYQELASDVVKTAAGKPIPKFIRYTKAVAQAIKKALGALVSAMATASIFFSPDSFAQTEGRTIKTDSTKTIAKGTMPDSAMAGMSDAGKLSLAIISNDKEFKKGVAFVADKPNARLYVFKDGKYQGETAALFGRTKGDVQTEYGASTGKPNLKSFLESDKVTPAGKYAATAMDVAGYGRLVYFNNDDGLAIHVNKSSGDTRQFRLETPTPLDNKVTFGCVNTTQDFYDKYLSTLPLNEQATVYVVPEVYSPSEVFEMGGKASGANRKGGASFTSQFAVRDQAEVRPMAEVDKLNPLTNAGLALAQTFVDYKARGKYEIQQAIFAAEKEGNTESVVANRKLLEQMGVAANAGAVVTDRLMDNIVKPLNKKIIAIAKKAGGSMTPDGLQIGAGEYAVARHSLHLSKKRAAQIADELAATKATLDFAIDVKAISRQIEKEIDLAKTKILDSVQRLRDGKIVSKSTVNKQVNEIHALINTIVGGTNNELTKNELTKLNNALLNAVQDQATLGNIETMAAIGKRLAEQAVELTDLKAARAAYNKAKTASEQWMQAQGQVSRYKGDTTQQAAIPLPSGLTIKEAQSIINDREAESPSYKEVADLYVQAFRDINQDRVNRGAASQEELDALTKENPFYVSTSGQTSATVETNIGFGRSRQWYDVAEGAQSFFNSQRTLANIVAKTQQAGNQEAATRIGKAAYESFVAGGDLFEETSPTNTDALRYEKDGIKYYLTGKTEPVRKSFKVLSEEVSKQAIVKGHAYFTSLYGRTLTQYVPIFSPINFSKDIGTRFFNFIGRRDIVREDGTQLGKMGAYSLRGNFLKQLARPSLYSDAFNFAWRGIETDSLKAFRTEGGLMTFSDSLTTAEEISAEFKTPLKAVPAKVINAINKIAHKYNQVLEVALVLASYRAMVAEGLSSQSAAFQTLDMMNFGQKGVLTNPLLRPFYAFINPTAQDALQIKRTLYKDGQFNIAAAAEFSALVGLSVLAYGMLRDADEEDEFGKKKVDSQGAGTVSRNLMIPDGSGGYYKLGVPFGLPQIAYSWGVAYHRMLDGVYTEKEAAGEMIGSMAKAFTLTGGSEVPMVRDFSTWLTYTASPTLYKPFITTALGKDAFGNNIKPYQRKDRLASEQGGFQTAEAYKEAAQWGQKTLGIDRAPEEYKALVEGYFVGPMRAVVNAIVDKQADNDIKGIDKKEPTPLETALGFTRVKSSTSDVNIVNHYYYKATADADAIVLKMNTEIPKTALRESFEQKIERFKQAGATDEEVNILEAKNEYDKTYSKFLANRKVAYGKFIGGDDEASALMGQYFAEDMEEKRKFLKVVFANKEKP